MSENLELITVNEKKDYHNCEMTFSCYYKHAKSDFKVDKDQKYKIHTTLKEVEVLNEALNIYQAEGFKDQFLLFSVEVDATEKYPDFVSGFEKSQALAKELNGLANDEDSLVQLTEYCVEVAPTYADDFGINKQIESISFNGEVRAINGYTDLKEYVSGLNK